MRSRSLAHAFVGLALLAGAAAVAHRMRIRDERPYDIAFIPSATALRWASLGHPLLAANLDWLRAVQYAGDPRANERGWEKLRPLVELITDLDPRHGYAYQVGANMLSSAGLLDDANAILEKGARNVPDRYILPFHRAVNAFLYEGDHALAGRWFEQAARVPGAPPHLRDYVLAHYVKGNAADAAISFLRHMETQAEDEDTRNAIREQVKRAVLERDATMLEEAAERYQERFGAAPTTLEQLVREGLVAAIPPDPFGGTYRLFMDGRVRSSANPRRFDRPLAGAARDEAMREARERLKTFEHQTEEQFR